MNVVFSDGFLINEKGRKISDKTLFYCWGFDKIGQKHFNNDYAFELFAIENRATGATMAIRKQWIKPHNPLWDIIPHDHTIALQAILDDSCIGYIDKCLISYRCHNNQEIGINNSLECPTSNNIYSTFTQVDLSNLPLIKFREQELHFLNWRKRNKYTFGGGLKSLSKVKDYRYFYKRKGKIAPYYILFILHDIFFSLRHTIAKSFHLLTSK